MNGLLATVAFFTRIPVARWTGRADGPIVPVWLPLLGLLVGGVMAGTRALAGLAFDPVPATLLAVLAAILVTGAFHEDGLADAVDAGGAHASRARKAEILHDPRVGTYGALALVFAVALPVVFLAPLTETDFARAAIAGHVLGRWSTLPLALVAHDNERIGADPRDVLLASALAAVIVVPLGAAHLALGAAVTAAVGGLVLARSIGRVNGDVFGAVNKIAELGAYAAAAVAAR